jgi:hypothetical protein
MHRVVRKPFNRLSYLPEIVGRVLDYEETSFANVTSPMIEHRAVALLYMSDEQMSRLLPSDWDHLYSEDFRLPSNRYDSMIR